LWWYGRQGRELEHLEAGVAAHLLAGQLLGDFVGLTTFGTADAQGHDGCSWWGEARFPEAVE
jgi:hypothetical protein